MKRIRKVLFCILFAGLLNIIFQYSSFSVQAAETLGTPKMVSVTESGTNRAVIKWEKVTGASGYRIYRKVSGKKWTALNTISNANTTTYTDSGLTSKTRYFYTVRAYKRTSAGVIWSSYETYGVSLIAGFNNIYVWKGTAAQLKAYKPSIYPLQEMGKNGFLVKWKMLSGADGYRVYRRVEGGKWTIVKTLTGGSNYYYADNGLTTGVQYFYTVAAYKRINGKIVWSSFQNAGVGQYAGASVIKALQAATPEVSVAENGKKNVVKWKAVTGADGYNIYRKESGQSWKRIKTVSGTVISYTDSNVLSGRAYSYSVRAYIKIGSAVQWSKYNTAGVKIVTNRSNIAVRPEYMMLGIGETYTLTLTDTAETPTWVSNNKNIVTVNAKGVIKGIATGTTTVVAKLNGITFVSHISVGALNKSLSIVQRYYTQNPCLADGKTCTKIGIQVHSIGCAQSSSEVLYNSMNNPNYQAGVHYLVDAQTPGKVIQTMPENIRSWADGGFGNNNLISMEICESNYMKYTTGANYEILNKEKFFADVRRGYETAVQLCAHICKERGWDPTSKLSNGLYLISSHDEGRLAGLSTSHVDPTHLWTDWGYSMNRFRSDVKAAMKNIK